MPWCGDLQCPCGFDCRVRGTGDPSHPLAPPVHHAHMQVVVDALQGGKHSTERHAAIPSPPPTHPDDGVAVEEQLLVRRDVAPGGQAQLGVRHGQLRELRKRVLPPAGRAEAARRRVIWAWVSARRLSHFRTSAGGSTFCLVVWQRRWKATGGVRVEAGNTFASVHPSGPPPLLTRV